MTAVDPQAALRHELYIGAPEPTDQEPAAGGAWRPRRDVAADVKDPAEGAEPLADRLADLTHGLPPGTGLLRVTRAHRAGHDHYRLDFHLDGTAHSSSEKALVNQRRLAGFTLSEMIAKADNGHGEDCEERLMNHWRLQTELLSWLRLLRRGPNPALMVHDSTDYEIPWELVYGRLRPDPTSHAWLGAEMPVVRWADVPGRPADAVDHGSPSSCVGGALLLEADDLPPLSDPIRRFRVADDPADMRALLRTLDHGTAPAGLALLVVRVRGEYDYDSRCATLGGLRYRGFHRYPMGALSTTPALVFLSACSSGRALFDPDHPETPQTFAEIFLARGARGVVATCGYVLSDSAHDLVDDLVEQATHHPVSIAWVLLEYRRQAARHLADRTDSGRAGPRDYRLFFDAFAYIYFGHPDTTLKLEYPRVGGAT